MFNPCKVLFVYHDILGNSSCPRAKHSDLLWGGKSWQLCIPPFSEGHCITWQPCWDRSPLQKERLGQHLLRKKTCIRCLGFQSFTLKLTSPWSCANHDKLCCYCESLIFDQYVTSGHLTESFFIFFQFFCLLKIKLLCKSLPFFFFFQRLQRWWVIVSLFTSAGISRQFSTWFHIQSVLMFSLNPNC